MKKFLMMAVVAMGLLFTACSKDEVAQPVAEKSTVTFSVAAPELATRAHGDGTLAKNLTYAVYNRDGGAKLFDGTATMNAELKATVEIPFVNGMTYDILFWAESENSPYEVNWTAKTVGYANASALVSNSMDYDAFYAYVNDIPEITGPVTKTVELKRPFAQLNIITNDAKKAEQSGVKVEDVKVVVKKGYTAFNFVSGNGINQGAVTFGTVAKQAAADTEGVQLLAVNYLFTGGEKSLVDVEFTYTDENGKLGDAGLTKEYASVPVQRNYRTNIVGSLLTSEGKFNIDILPGFEPTEHNVEVVSVTTAQDLQDAINNAPAGEDTHITLTDDIDLNDLSSLFSQSASTRAGSEDASLKIVAGKKITLDLGGKTLSAVSNQTGKNYDMIDVRGTLTVTNGTITTEHKGTNMGWNNSTNVFNVTAGGVLNLEGVTAKNLGGSDMAFVAHLNNWGEVTLNVNNSTLESTYIAVRVFNSGYDMNNVTIKNSTLKGKYCFWVHNYKAAGDSVGTDDTLNFDIYNNNNKFENTSKAPVLYGFNSPIYIDENGNKLVYSADDLASAIAVGGKCALQNDIEVSDIIFIGNSVKINGNGHSISTTANRVMRITAPDINVELNNVNIVSNAVRVGTNDIRGISVDNTASGLNLTLNDCNVDFTDASAYDWAYAVNQVATTNNTISINGGTYEGANVINIWGSNNTIKIDGATLNCLYKPNTQYWGSCIAFNSSASDNTATVKNTTFNSPGGDAIAIWDNGSNNTVSEENNTDNTTVATFIYNAEELLAAVDEKKSAILNADIEISEPLTVVGKVFSLDLNGKTLTAPQSSALVAQEGADLTVKNGKVIAYESTVRAIGGKATIESGEYTSTGTAADTPATYRYSIDSREGGEIIINGGTFKSNNGMLNVSSTVTINGGKFENIVEKSITRHFAYVSALLTINDGEFYGKANSGAGGCFFCGAAAGCDIQVNGGKFTSLWTSGSVNRIFEVYYGGTINVTGGLFNTNGGIADFVTENTDDATKGAYPYKAK